MSSISVSPVPPVTTVSFQASIGRPAVGLETPENKNATLPPVEEPTAADKRRGKADVVDPDAERDGHPRRENPSSQLEIDQPPPQTSTVSPDARLDTAAAFVVDPEPALGASGLMRALALAASDASGRNAIRAFDEVQRESEPSNPLIQHLDQRI